jgi:hypothetical protein
MSLATKAKDEITVARILNQMKAEDASTEMIYPIILTLQKEKRWDVLSSWIDCLHRARADSFRGVINHLAHTILSEDCVRGVAKKLLDRFEGIVQDVLVPKEVFFAFYHAAKAQQWEMFNTLKQFPKLKENNDSFVSEWLGLTLETLISGGSEEGVAYAYDLIRDEWWFSKISGESLGAALYEIFKKSDETMLHVLEEQSRFPELAKGAFSVAIRKTVKDWDWAMVDHMIQRAPRDLQSELQQVAQSAKMFTCDVFGDLPDF